MPTIACPNCHKKLNVPEKYAGRSAKCPACHGVFQVPPREPAAIDLEAVVEDMMSKKPATAPPAATPPVTAKPSSLPWIETWEGSAAKLNQPVDEESPTSPPPLPSGTTPETPHQAFKACPLCGEQILAVALKCKHCGSMLSETAQIAKGSSASEPADTAQVVLTLSTSGGSSVPPSRLPANPASGAGYVCPNCHKNLNVPESYAGRSMNCPACHKPFVVKFPLPVILDAEPIVAEHSQATPPAKTVSAVGAEQPAQKATRNRSSAMVIGTVAIGAIVAAWIFNGQFSKGTFGDHEVVVYGDSNNGFPRIETMSESDFLFRCAALAFLGGGACTIVLYVIATIMTRLVQSTAAGPETARLSVSRKVTQVAVIGGIVGAVIGTAIGVYVSQYCPIFGGFAVIGAPWSPARESLIGSHVLAFASAFVLLGGGIPAALVYLNNPPESR